MTLTSDAILQRMMTLHPKVIDLTLDRVWQLLGALGDPQDRLPPVIHIAGTNGKGSTQAMIRAGLEAQGRAVHAYTSPHLARFHERIRLAGSLIAEDALAALLDRVEAANGTVPITYFEITTVAALLAFADTPADFTLLEVGLGGRLDATNVVARPALTIITPVDLDHQSYLGHTLPLIAAEKAGIIKRGVTCIVGPQHDDCLAVIERQAARLGAPLLVHGQHWHVSEERGGLIYQDERGLLDLPLPALPGPHQIGNAGMAIAALRHLAGDDAETASAAAMTRVAWPARMQRLDEGALADLARPAELWLDGGHNPAAGAVLAQTLKGLPPRPTHLICGMLNTKDIAGYLSPLTGVAASLTAVSIPGEAATIPAEETARHAASVSLAATIAPDVETALRDLSAKGPVRVLICGSLYLAGHVLRLNGTGGPV
ncbi:bifunctional folylpolyglutamate synthase/dihydrofolate synthase [Loktanella sp. DJP18]|uniref:bifunctional folylpolyglutamate synthase/dihydrofolate synthase n=1 Tax=Loktanella sp. DJP18 TaxID=3409788 RepID=UPI003BB52F9A